MSNARDIIIRPIITEKTMKLMDTDNKITFAVVNILNCKPKTKRMGKYVGKTSAVRKAVVKLPEGQDINLFSE